MSKKWIINLNMDTHYSSSHVIIWADDVIQNGETSVIADIVVIDFENEILGISEVEDGQIYE
jgi:hypothetical protein